MGDDVGRFSTVEVKKNKKKTRKENAPQVCIQLFLSLVINTTPQDVARAGSCRTTRFSTYFASQAGKGVGGAGEEVDRAAFIELTKEYMSPVGH